MKALYVSSALFVATSFVMFVAAAPLPTGYTVRENAGLKKTKTVTSMEYRGDAFSGNHQLSLMRIGENIFDTHGNLLQETEYKPDRKIIKRWIYTYNSNNQKIRSERYNASGYPTDRWVFKYDGKLQLVESIWHAYEYEWTRKITNLYSVLGLLTNTTTYGDDGAILEKSEFVYDNIKRLLVRMDYDNKTSRIRKTVHKYDVNGRLIAVTYYRDKHILIDKYAYRYDSQNRRVESVCYRGEDAVLTSKNLTEYDTRGLIVKDTSYEYRFGGTQEVKCGYTDFSYTFY